MIFDIIKNVKNAIIRSTAFTVSSCEDDYCYISGLDSWIGFFTDSLEICVSNQLIKYEGRCGHIAQTVGCLQTLQLLERPE